MRIDLFLKTSRLLKRRAIAKEACDRELVSVNGKAVKPSFEVKAGDRIFIKLGTRRITVTVMSTETKNYADMYKVTEEAAG